MLTYEQNVKAVLECIFAGYKDELIEDACRRICALSSSENPNTCEDAISRQAVIDILDDMVKNYVNENDFDKVQGIAWVKVQRLPSVTPQQRTGRWKFIVYDVNRIGHYECSECHWNVLMNVSAYCPHCGTKMEVEE